MTMKMMRKMKWMKKMTSLSSRKYGGQKCLLFFFSIKIRAFRPLLNFILHFKSFYVILYAENKNRDVQVGKTSAHLCINIITKLVLDVNLFLRYLKYVLYREFLRVKDAL